jgi:hypothetical protein
MAIYIQNYLSTVFYRQIKKPIEMFLDIENPLQYAEKDTFFNFLSQNQLSANYGPQVINPPQYTFGEVPRELAITLELPVEQLNWSYEYFQHHEPYNYSYDQKVFKVACDAKKFEIENKTPEKIQILVDKLEQEYPELLKIFQSRKNLYITHVDYDLLKENKKLFKDKFTEGSGLYYLNKGNNNFYLRLDAKNLNYSTLLEEVIHANQDYLKLHNQNGLEKIKNNPNYNNIFYKNDIYKGNEIFKNKLDGYHNQNLELLPTIIIAIESGQINPNAEEHTDIKNYVSDFFHRLRKEIPSFGEIISENELFKRGEEQYFINLKNTAYLHIASETRDLKILNEAINYFLNSDNPYGKFLAHGQSDGVKNAEKNIKDSFQLINDIQNGTPNPLIEQLGNNFAISIPKIKAALYGLKNSDNIKFTDMVVKSENELLK